MKNQLIALALTVAATTGLRAQQTQATALRSENHTEVMVKELGLSAEQTPKVEQINTRFAKAMSDLKATGLDETSMNKRATVLRDGRDRELKGVLTPEQYEKMLTLRKEKHAEGMQRKQETIQHNE